MMGDFFLKLFGYHFLFFKKSYDFFKKGTLNIFIFKTKKNIDILFYATIA